MTEADACGMQCAVCEAPVEEKTEVTARSSQSAGRGEDGSHRAQFAKRCPSTGTSVFPSTGAGAVRARGLPSFPRPARALSEHGTSRISAYALRV